MIYFPLKDVWTSWLYAFQQALDAVPGLAQHYTSLAIPACSLWARVDNPYICTNMHPKLATPQQAQSGACPVLTIESKDCNERTQKSLLASH